MQCVTRPSSQVAGTRQLVLPFLFSYVLFIHLLAASSYFFQFFLCLLYSSLLFVFFFFIFSQQFFLCSPCSFFFAAHSYFFHFFFLALSLSIFSPHRDFFHFSYVFFLHLSPHTAISYNSSLLMFSLFIFSSHSDGTG